MHACSPFTVMIQFNKVDQPNQPLIKLIIINQKALGAIHSFHMVGTLVSICVIYMYVR